MAAQNPVVDFILIDRSFPSGRESPGSMDLQKELQEKYPRGYVQGCRDEGTIREKLIRQLEDATVKEIISLSRHEVDVRCYWMRYFHLRFVPVDGYWII